MVSTYQEESGLAGIDAGHSCLSHIAEADSYDTSVDDTTSLL